MHKWILTAFLLSLSFSSVWATNAEEALNFYKQQISAFPTQNSRENRLYASALANALDTWIQQNPQHASAPEVRLWQARLLLRAQEKGAAAVALLQLRGRFAQPDLTSLTPLFEEAVEGLHKDYRQTALQSFKAEPVATQKPAEKEAHVLYTLSKLAGKEYYPAAAQAFERFFSTYPNYTGNNEIELWYGDLHRVNGNYLAAITQYKKADKLYPQSPYKAASLRLIGDIYADNLKNTEAATQAYTTVLRLYPDSSETGIVYKHMAILDENNKQYDSALINYDKAIELLGTTPAAYEAYRGKADVYVKTKNYTEAYQTLHKAATVFQTNPGQAAQALEEAAQIARKKLQDEVKYTQSLEKAIALAPHATQTAENMYVLAHAYEKQGKTAQAQEMYKRLILNFPTHKQAAKAQNRLTGLSK